MKPLSYSNSYISIDEETEELMPPVNRRSNDNSSKLQYGVIAATTLTVIGIIAFSQYGQGSLSTKAVENAFASSGSSQIINFALARKNYGAVPYFDKKYTSRSNYAFLKDYLSIIEPHADMVLQLYDGSENSFEFKACSSSGVCMTGTQTKTESTPIKFSCSPYDEFDLTVTEYDSTKKEVASVKGKAVCLYVRREINQLTKEDLQNLMDKQVILSRVSDSAGVSKYGKNYRSLDSLVGLHHFGASTQEQDHIHEGNGFLLQHLKITNMFEDSLQSVDPSVSLPYWDFTRDYANGLEIYNNPLFSDKVFGSSGLPKHLDQGFTYKSDKLVEAKIPDGYWANSLAQMNPFGEDYNFAYGYMRSPWNMNPSPFQSRFTKGGHLLELPTCSSHYNIVQYDDKMDFYMQTSLSPHATIHALAGGIYGCDKLESLYEGGYITSLSYVCNNWIFVLKEMYRYGYLVPMKGCTINKDDMEASECGFTCPAETQKSLATATALFLHGYVDTSKADFDETIIKFICDGGDGSKIFPGDHLESASPADPSFWVIHPTLERLLHFKLMSGGFETDAWETDQVNEYVCNKANCYSLEKNSYSYADSCCYGHYENDRLYDGFTGDKSKFVGQSNSELERASNPLSKDYALTYIFDDFAWDHCEDDFEALSQDMYQDSLGRDIAAMSQGLRRTSEKRKVPRPAAQEALRAAKKEIVSRNAKLAK